ncbi:interleukin-20-like [Ambystoma mexicanum]|uniref:interleukin-20-like n=1 Tax=Ambystoma mexicanum TaxID=8296 RepID=UPI0037E9C466
MKGGGLYLGVLSAVIISCCQLVMAHRRLHLGHCELSVNVHDIRECFSKIRKIIQSQDENDDLRIVEKSSLQEVRPEERCCLLRHLLRFYMHQVFRNCNSNDHHLRRTVSHIANSFLSMKKDLSLCHDHMTCNCAETSRIKYEAILNNFDKVDHSLAATKALGELDVLLDWLDRL